MAGTRATIKHIWTTGARLRGGLSVSDSAVLNWRCCHESHMLGSFLFLFLFLEVLFRVLAPEELSEELHNFCYKSHRLWSLGFCVAFGGAMNLDCKCVPRLLRIGNVFLVYSSSITLE